MKAWQPLLLLAGLTAALLALRASGFDARQAVDGAGRHGPLAFVAFGALACALSVPRQVTALAGGFAFGFWPGVALAMLAQILGCAVDFALARSLGRPAALRFLERRAGGRLRRMERFLSERAFTTTLTLRLLPVGNNVALNLVAGASSTAAAPFLLASLIGYVPQTVVFALAGSGAGLSDGSQLMLAAGLMLVSVAIGITLLRRRPSLG